LIEEEDRLQKTRVAKVQNKKPIVAHWKGQGETHAIDREKAKHVAMNFVLENRNGSDPYFDRREEPENTFNMSDHLLFSLGQLSISEYKNRLELVRNQPIPKRTIMRKVRVLGLHILASD
jgi:hypothetical protein